jgi:nucleoside-diphosphate-sugar epimerase
MRILITGADGYIGSSLVRNLHEEYEVVGITREDCDITSTGSVSSFFEKQKSFDFVIHCAITGGSREKIDDSSITHNNLVMFNNLIAWKDIKFESIINIGSGAEFDRRYIIHPLVGRENRRMPIDPYGMSKFYINQYIQNIHSAYNLRIFGIFDENELERRFIKSCITNYIHGKPMKMYTSAQMDFIYMNDFISMVRMVLDKKIPYTVKSFDCVYSSYELPSELNSFRSLSNIAEYHINKSLGGNECPIEHSEEFKPSFNMCYLGNPPTWMNQNNLVGIKEGIKRTYEKLKERYETNNILHS